jgi:Na+/H+-dicarboxylate symporter
MPPVELFQGGSLTSELWQFAALVGAFFVAAVLWLFIIYLPARTMEHSETRRVERGDDGSRSEPSS